MIGITVRVLFVAGNKKIQKIRMVSFVKEIYKVITFSNRVVLVFRLFTTRAQIRFSLFIINISSNCD